VFVFRWHYNLLSGGCSLISLAASNRYSGSCQLLRTSITSVYYMYVFIRMEYFLKCLPLPHKFDVLSHVNGIDLINLWQAIGTDRFTQLIPFAVIKKEIFPLAVAFSELDLYDRRSGEQCIYVWDHNDIEKSLFIFLALSKHRCCNPSSVFFNAEFNCCCKCGYFTIFDCFMHNNPKTCRRHNCDNYRDICACVGKEEECTIRIGDKYMSTFSIIDTFLDAKDKVFKTNVYFHNNVAHLIINYINFDIVYAVARSEGNCSPDDYDTREFKNVYINPKLPQTFKMLVPTVYLNFEKQTFDKNIVKRIFPEYVKTRFVKQHPMVDSRLIDYMTREYSTPYIRYDTIYDDNTRFRVVDRNNISKHQNILYKYWIHNRDIKSTTKMRTRFPPYASWETYADAEMWPNDK
jgi:hypothetical protein